MPLDVQGILTPLMLGTEQATILYPYLREIFVNETPLVTRLDRKQAEAESYTILSYDIRPRKYTLTVAVSGTSITTATLTTLTLADASPLLVGDVLELISTDGSATERVEVQADPIIAAGTVSVRRRVEGTVAIANDVSANQTVTMIGNSRTGGEINQTANRANRTGIPQNVQTFQFPVQVGGKTMAVSNIRLPTGISDVFTLEQKVKMTEMMRDEEYTSYYGLGDKPGVNNNIRAKQSGLKKLIGYFGSTDSGVTPGPNVDSSAKSSFTKFNFVSAIQKAFDAGGNPNVVLCSTNFMTALATWSAGQQYFMDQRANAIGLAIREFQVAFLGMPLTFVPSLQLKAGTFCALTWEDVFIRQLRPEQFIKRGVMGDASQGDFLCDLCIELGHPGWHVFSENISTFA